MREFQDKRYIGPANGSWRFCGSEIAERKPTVCRLQIHLEGDQTVYFDSNNKDQSMERVKRSECIKLTAFFELDSSGNPFSPDSVVSTYPGTLYMGHKEKGIE